MNIGIRIKHRREDLKMSAEELGNKIGKAKTTIYRYETGAIENMPSTVLEPIAKALRTTPAYLMGWTDLHDINKQNYAGSPNIDRTETQKIPMFGDIIKQLRKEKKITQMQFAKHLNISNGTVGNWEINTRQPDSDMLIKIATYFGVSVDFLLGREDAISCYKNIIPLPETELIPLVGTIACGTPTLAVENIDEYIKADKSIKATFALRCKGDSMINARIFDGDIVYIHQQADIENGEIAAVLIENEATLKRVFKYKDRLELRAENPMYQPLNIEGETLNSIRILGKAVAFFSTIR